MTKEELDKIASYINRENLVKCPYQDGEEVPKVCLEFCDTCVYKSVGYEHSQV